jgi:DNA-binding response OmpR family regulator
VENSALMQFPQGGSVLLVEDNVRISQEMAQMMNAAGLSTRCAMDADELRALIAVSVPDLVLLDLNLPGEDGISICKWLRKVYPRIGIVILTARVMGCERSQGYLSGADIYLTKPTRAEELLAVLRNLLIRLRAPDAMPSARHGNTWVLHETEMRLESPEQDQLRLNLKETLILKRLSESQEAVDYQSLIESIALNGGDVVIEKNRLEVIVSRLRAKLESLDNAGIEIKTVHKTGFLLSHPLVIRTKEKRHSTRTGQ